jgi:response regulator RpfG family c-di-GMP phosphodiesterase
MAVSIRILLADPDEVAQAAHQRQLSSLAEMELCSSGAAALAALAQKGPFAAVISEVSLTDMSGAEFLARARTQASDTVRMVLTASTDLAALAEVVNRGAVFRLLSKSGKPHELVAAVRDAAVQHLQNRRHREILEQSFDGVLELLTGEFTSQAIELPPAAKQLRERARQLAQVVRLPFTQDLEIAVVLMRLALASIPKHVRDKLQSHDPLTPAEKERLARLPEVTAQVVDHIPRLAGVAEIIRHDGKPDEEGAPRKTGARQQDVPLAARILRAVVDLQMLEESGLNAQAALLRLRQDAVRYDRTVLKAMEALFADPRLSGEGAPEEFMVENLVARMVLAIDAMSTEGVSLVSAGTMLTPGLIQHLRNFAELGEIVQPLYIRRSSVKEAEQAEGE